MRTIRRECKHGKFLSCYPHIVDATAEMQCILECFSFLFFLLFLNNLLNPCKIIFCSSSILSVFIVEPAKGAEYLVY